MIKLLSNYPYDNKYDYIKLFANKTEQINFFNKFINITIDLDDDSYIKEGESFIIEYEYDYLVTNNINYLIFNNGYKDLFCFIIKKEYVDEENTRIIYEVDVLNTFCFDFKIKNSYVERMNCSINEISDYDEGLNIGEHEIVENYKCFDKEYTYFAMFGGIKNQQIIWNGSDIENVIETPYATLKPRTYIDGIQYPLFFMPMKESYREPSVSDIFPPGAGDNVNNSLRQVKNSLGIWYVPTHGIISATYPYYPSGGQHSGIDIANAEGTPIFASRSGTVKVKDYGNTSYGKSVWIYHSDGSYSIYGHNSQVTVKDGDVVQTGEQIALMGSTGNSTGNHCHWEIRDKNGNSIHPAPQLKVGDNIGYVKEVK